MPTACTRKPGINHTTEPTCCTLKHLTTNLRWVFNTDYKLPCLSSGFATPLMDDHLQDSPQQPPLPTSSEQCLLTLSSCLLSHFKEIKTNYGGIPLVTIKSNLYLHLYPFLFISKHLFHKYLVSTCYALHTALSVCTSVGNTTEKSPSLWNLHCNWRNVQETKTMLAEDSSGLSRRAVRDY